MKRILSLSVIVMLFLAMVQPAAAGPLSVVAQEGNPPPEAPTLANPIYLPAVMVPLYTYTVSGQIKGANDLPLSGVSVASDTGEKATTNANGVYQMAVQRGERQISASKPGYNLDPRPAWLNLNKNMNNVNFSSGAACTQPVPNPSFETVPYYWNPISGMANGYKPIYSTLHANTGTTSGLTGILDGYPNLGSWSRWRTHEITIPISATSADVSLFYWPKSTETVMKAEGETPSIVGLNADAEKLPTAGDFQYIAVIDAATNVISVTLMSSLSNAQAWTASGTLSFLAFAGKTIKLEFGTVNDGFGGVTSTFFDDVVVTVCDSGSVVTCANLLTNSDFTGGATGWTIRTALLPSAPATDFFYSATTSMLSGVPLASTPPAYGQWRTSEFFQQVTIPATATSALLKVRILPHSSDLWGYHIAEQAALDSLIASGNAPEAAESQYGFICTNCSAIKDITTLKTLFKWYPIDSANWLYREFDLKEFKGQSIGILFGAQDWGDYGNTSLYIDDVYLDVCSW